MTPPQTHMIYKTAVAVKHKLQVNSLYISLNTTEEPMGQGRINQMAKRQRGKKAFMPPERFSKVGILVCKRFFSATIRH